MNRSGIFDELFTNSDASKKVASGLGKVMNMTQELKQNLEQKAGEMLGQEAVFCPACNVQLRSVAKFCDQCGTPIPLTKCKAPAAVFQPEDFDFLNADTPQFSSADFDFLNDSPAVKPDSFSAEDFDFLND